MLPQPEPHCVSPTLTMPLPDHHGGRTGAARLAQTRRWGICSVGSRGGVGEDSPGAEMLSSQTAAVRHAAPLPCFMGVTDEMLWSPELFQGGASGREQGES